MSTLIPIADRVLLKEIEKESKSGIILPEDAKDSVKGETREGEVIAVGSEVRNVEVGMIVFYNNYNADPLEDFFLVNEDSVLAYRDNEKK